MSKPHKSNFARFGVILLPILSIISLVAGGQIGNEALVGVGLLGLVVSAIWGMVYYGAF